MQLVDALTDAGLGYIEVGSFVSPKWVPQMAGSAEDGALIDHIELFADDDQADSRNFVMCQGASAIRFPPAIRHEHASY